MTHLIRLGEEMTIYKQWEIKYFFLNKATNFKLTISSSFQ